MTSTNREEEAVTHSKFYPSIRNKAISAKQVKQLSVADGQIHSLNVGIRCSNGDTSHGFRHK